MHPIENIMRSAMEEIRTMVDVDTIVGKAIYSQNGTVILPISRVSFGFISGGGEYLCGEQKRSSNQENSSQYPFSGGASAGISLRPMAFIVANENAIRLLHMDDTNWMDKLLEIVPQAFSLVRDILNKEPEKSCCCENQEQQTIKSANTDLNDDNQSQWVQRPARYKEQGAQSAGEIE